MIGWLQCTSGVSGDMVLGSLLGAGVPLAVIQEAVDAVSPEPVTVLAEPTTRAGVAATGVRIEGTRSTAHRTWADVRVLLERGCPRGVEQALAVFEALARAEGRVHGVAPEDVHFHEVGALDAVADVVGACAGFSFLGLERLVVSPVAVGGGTVDAAHGRLPVPGPAVVELLAGAPTHGGPVDHELATPTGAALVSVLGDAYGAQPPMRVRVQGFGAGSRDHAGHANVLRLVLGVPAPSAHDADDGHPERHVVLESNVDDLDPRVWPDVLARLLEAGADDAWLVPIQMKKGRPAHTLCVLSEVRHVPTLRGLVFTHTSAIGLRERPVTKHALDRAVTTVEVGGHVVRVKLSRFEGRTVTAQPEWDDVAAAARALDAPARDVLARAASRATQLQEQA